MKRKEISRLIASTLTATVALNSYSGNIRVVSATTNSNVSSVEESEDENSVNESDNLSDLSGVSTEQMQMDFESVANDTNNKNSIEDSSSDGNTTDSESSSTSEDTNSNEENPTPVVSEDFNISSSSKRLISTLSETVTESQFVYLSDIKNDINLSNLDWALKLDKSSSGEGIHLLVDGQDKTFTKGIGVDSNAVLVYDVSEYANKYTRLVGYIGVDYRQRNQTIADGVDFTVEVSSNGTEWRVARDIGIKKASQEAYKLDVNLEGVKYVRLSALCGPNNNKSYDHAVFADIKLAQSDYEFVGENESYVYFSFSGQYANKILVDTNSSEEISYSLDGGSNWNTSTDIGISNGCKVINLSTKEVESITATNDVKVKIGSDVYTVDITTASAPTTNNIYGNDWEDRLIGSISGLEYRLNENDTWKDYTSVTKFEGNQTVEVRYKASGTSVASSSIKYTFTESTDTPERTYIPLSGVHLHTFCSQQNNGYSDASNMLDGNANTLWHNNWNGESNLYYSVQFDEVKFISSIEYLPQTGANGRLRSGEILVSYDGVNWDSAGTFKDLKNNSNLQTITLSTPSPARYLKIVATETWGNVQNVFFTGRMLNFYEDTTKTALTEPVINYSNTEKTTNPVTASIILPEGCTAEIKTHKFLENGSYNFEYRDSEGNVNTVMATVENITNAITDKGVYLSDLDTYDGTSIGYGSLMKDKNPSGGLISLIVDGSPMTFNKGIGIHAPTTVVYNIERFSNEYSRFTGYLGVDSSRGTNGTVKFVVSASKDGKTWDTLKTTDVLRGNTESVYVDVNVKGYNYLKIYADQTADWNGSDHSVVADARLVQENYSTSSEYYAGFKTLAQYDAEISSKSIEENYANNKKQILEREFVNRYGYNNIISASRNIEGVYEALEWLQNDDNALQLLIEAGNLFSGNGYNALKALGGLYLECKEDLNTPIYEKMILATVAGYSKDIKPFMVNYGGGCLGANPVESYKAIKEIYDSEGGFVRKSEFNTYSMELIRAVMDARINYDEIAWLRAYIEKKYPAATNINNWVRYNGYGYASYVNIGYGSADLYSEENRQKWDEKYNLSEYGVEYGLNNIYRAWMFMEKGAICWGLSGLGMVVNEVQGIPAVGTFQAGHEAYLLYSQDANGKGKWNISDDIAGWGGSFTRWGGTTQTEHRLLLGWGQKEYNTLNGGNNTSYMLLAQDALNDYDNYLESMFYNLIANSYETSDSKHEEALNESLNHYSKNLDSIYNLYKSYLADESTTDEEWADLAEMVAEEYKYFPAPMVDLLKLIKAQIEDESLKISVDIMQNNSLTAASVATANESLQNGACQQVAKSLLGNNSTVLATFSFSGENANKIMINDAYANSTIQVRVSLDGGKTWEVFENGQEFTTNHVIELSKEQINKISADTDILVGLMGRPENHTIDIKAGKTLDMSSIYLNDQENSLIGGDQANLEYSTDGGDTWHDYVGGLNPNIRFEGDVEVSFRYKANGLTLSSNISTLTFTADNDTAESKYVSLSNVSLFDYSSEQIVSSSGAGNASHIIDGNFNTRYHSTWEREDNEKYLVFEFDKVRFINKIGYMPFKDDSGEMKSGNVYVSMDGLNWTLVHTYESLPNISSPDWKYIELGESYAAKYIKIDSTESYGDSNKYFAGRMLTFFEDSTKEYEGDPGIRYSTIDETSQYVIAELILEEGYSAEITSYKFTENGSYDFVYTNRKGETKTVTATVNNIVRDLDSTSVFLSDLNYESSSYAGWNGIRYNLAPGGKTIKIKVDGVKTEFARGIGAHTDSELIYDIGMFTDVYNKFQAYVGVDDASTGGSVNFKILASKDGETWDELQTTGTLTKSDNAVFVDVDVTGYEYLKLIADGGANTDNDHAVYAGAKLVRDTAIIHYSTSEYGEVTAKLYLPEGYSVVGNDTFVFDGNGKHTFEYTNSSNETQTIEAIVDWFENDTSEKDPNIDEGFGVDSEDDKDIADGEFDGDEGFGVEPPVVEEGGEDSDTSEDSSTSEKDENIDEGFEVDSEDDKDIADQYPDVDDGFGMRDPSTSEKDENLDDGFLVEDIREFEVTFDRETLTNQNVTATLEGLAPTDKVISEGGSEYIFKENGKHTFIIEDVNGNQFTKEIEVTWIDKEEVTATIAFDYSKAEEGIVIAKVTGFNKEDVVVTNTENNVDYVEFTTNDSFTFEFIDKAGNKGKVTANVNWFKFEDLTSLISYNSFVADEEVDSEETVTPDYVVATLAVDSEKVEILNNDGSNEVKFVKNGVFAFKARMLETGEEFEILVQVDWLAEDAAEDESPIELPNGTSEKDPNIDENFGVDSSDDKDIADQYPDVDEDFGMRDPSTSEDDPNIDDGFLVPDEDNSHLDGTTSEKDENIDTDFGVDSEDDKDIANGDTNVDDGFLVDSEESDVSEKDENVDDSFLIPDEDNSDLDGTTSEKDENIDTDFGADSEDDKESANGDDGVLVDSEDDKDIADQYPDVDEDFGVVPPVVDDSTDEDQTPVIPPVVEETPVVPPVTPDNGNNSGNANNSGNSSNSGSVNGGSGSGSSGGSGSNGGNGTTGGNGDGDDPNNGNSSDKDPNVDDSLLNSLLNQNGSDKRNPIKDLISMGINASISGTIEVPNRNESSKNETSYETNGNKDNITSNNSHSNSSTNSSNTHHKGFIEIVVDTVGEILGDVVSSTMGTISTATSSIFVWIRRFFGMGK